MHRPNSSRGQVVLITAFALVVLIGIAALVIDIGFSVMLRRQEQNAADPGAVAAARFIADDQTINMAMGEAAACHYARQNHFFASATQDVIGANGCIPANDAYGAFLDVIYPPNSLAGEFAGNTGMVQVIISRQQETFFGRIFGQSEVTVTTDAVAARQRGETNTHSLISLKPDGCDVALVRGNGTVKVYAAPGYTGPGGYVQVNSSCGNSTADDNCSTSSTGALKINGTAKLSAPKVSVHGGCTGKSDQPLGVPPGSDPLDEAAAQMTDPLAGLLFPPWDTSLPGGKCGQTGAATTAAASQGCGGGGSALPWKPSADSACPGMPAAHDCIELNPGIYYGGWDIGSKVRVTLKPGIYVIAGGGIKIGSSGSLDSLAGGSAPAPVLIYNTDNPVYASSCPAGTRRCQAELNLNAQVALKITGLRRDQPCPPVTPAVMTDPGCPFGGMVIWYDAAGSQPAGAGLVKINGGSELFISGTIYAPRAHVDIAGNSGTNCGTGTETQMAAVQIVSWTWDLGGTGDLCMPYDPTKLYKLNYQGLVH